MQRKNYHKKNSSGLLTTRTKKTSIDNKSKERTASSKSKQKPTDKLLQNKIKKRMSFQSPNQRDGSASARAPYQNLSLLNYMLFKEKHKESVMGSTMGMRGTMELRQGNLGGMAKDHFTVSQILGKGGFGRVYKVQYRKTKTIYAMKEMSKTVIITKKSIQSVLNQRQLLSQLKHPFIVNMVYAFQDRLNLYLVMDYMPGGDLRFQIGRYQKFPQHIVKFFICCIVLSLKYLHDNNIIHRDIKPQNLIFDAKGYLRLTDLGVARIHTPDNYKDTSGTPGYMAPEVINRQNHSFPVDYFALGVIAYQCMLGKRPYRGYNRQEIRQQMLLFEASIKLNQIPGDWNAEAANFINGLLKRKVSQRLGTRGIQQIMGHPWLREIDWNKMIGKKYPSPFRPNLEHRNYDTVSDSQYGQETEQRMAENGLLLRKKSVQDLFNGYEYQQVKLA